MHTTYHFNTCKPMPSELLCHTEDSSLMLATKHGKTILKANNTNVWKCDTSQTIPSQANEVHISYACVINNMCVDGLSLSLSCFSEKIVVTHVANVRPLL